MSKGPVSLKSGRGLPNTRADSTRGSPARNTQEGEAHRSPCRPSEGAPGSQGSQAARHKPSGHVALRSHTCKRIGPHAPSAHSKPGTGPGAGPALGPDRHSLPRGERSVTGPS